MVFLVGVSLNPTKVPLKEVPLKTSGSPLVAFQHSVARRAAEDFTSSAISWTACAG